MCNGSASSLSARAILSGRSSLISTNSSAWMRLTSFAGIGGRLLARQNGGGVARGVSAAKDVGREDRSLCQVGAVDCGMVDRAMRAGKGLGALVEEESRWTEEMDKGSAPGE